MPEAVISLIREMEKTTLIYIFTMRQITKVQDRKSVSPPTPTTATGHGQVPRIHRLCPSSM